MQVNNQLICINHIDFQSGDETPDLNHDSRSHIDLFEIENILDKFRV